MAAEQAEQRRVRTEDGTDLAYYAIGTGPPVLIANALGGDWRLWRYQIRYLADRYRLVTWDYRGLYGSNLARPDASVDIQTQARDALAVLQAEGIARAAVIGWSFGVPVAVQLFAQAPEQVANLVLLNGVVGPQSDADHFVKLVSRAWPLLLRIAARTPAPVERVMRRLVGSPEAMSWARRTGLVGRDDEEDVLREAAMRLARLDREALRRLLDAQMRFDGSGILPTVDVPTLYLCGERDPFVSRTAMEHQAQRIPKAEFVVIPGATHYLPVDSPQFLNLRIEKFFQERGYPSQGS